MSNDPRRPQFGKHVCIFELERKGGLIHRRGGLYGVRCLPLLSAGSATRHKTRRRDEISEISDLRLF